jgi:hypothetical protein
MPLFSTRADVNQMLQQQQEQAAMARQRQQQQAAMARQVQAQQAQGPQLAGIGTPSPKDFTTKSLAAFQQTGDPRSLERYFNPLQTARITLANDRFALQRRLAEQPNATERAAINNQLEAIDNLQYLQEDFKDDFVGFGFDVLGMAQEEYDRRFANDPAAVDRLEWWQDYRLWSNQVLRAQAGANLTANEEARFNRNQVKPGDNPMVARSKLANQQKIYRRNLRKEQMGLQGMGIDAGLIDREVNPQDMSDEEIMRALGGQ